MAGSFLAFVGVQHTLAQSNRVGCYLDQFIFLDVLQRSLQRDPPRGFEQDIII